MSSTKLELTWFDKEKEINVEPRILLKSNELSYKKEVFNLFDNSSFYENVLIHGDNLFGLKSIETKYTNSIKCVYIDPPYNTGSAFERYDDNLEHSTWLSLMKPRLEIIRKLLRDDGVIFIQIDNNEMAYLKVLCDEIFGRNNHLSTITIKVKAPAGVGQESFLFDVNEYILVYAKKIDQCKLYPHKIKEDLSDNVYKQYSSLIKFDIETIHQIGTLHSERNGDIDLMKIDSFNISRISQDSKNSAFYAQNRDFIIRTTNPQGGLMKKLLPQIPREGLYKISYKPSKGNKADSMIEYWFLNGSLIVWLKDSSIIENGEIYKLNKMTNLWTDNFFQGIANEGNVTLKAGKKPEFLIKRIFDLSTKEGDLVLDSFLGSGTTCAVAHKMRRRWIGIEMGNQVYDLCKSRLDLIINGNDASGITKAVNWTGGGGYTFYELAPTLINEDTFGEPIINKEYSADMLASAVALHEGFKYCPDPSCFWKQSKSNENSYLFVTTNHLTVELLKEIENKMADDEFLLIACKSCEKNCLEYSDKIKVKKIPQMLLGKCEFGKDNYNLNIVNPPAYDDEEDEENE